MAAHRRARARRSPASARRAATAAGARRRCRRASTTLAARHGRDGAPSRCTGPWSTPSTRSAGSPTRRTSTATSPRAAPSPSPRRRPRSPGSGPRSPPSTTFGFGDDDVRWLGPSEAQDVARRRGRAGRRLHPALRRHPPGPAGAGPGRGRRGGARRPASTSATPVLEIGPRWCAPTRGTVRAARRGPGHRGLHRRASPGSAARMAPLYSLMVATEPLPTRVLGRGRAGPTARPSPTAATSSSTPSAPPTGASPSAAAARRYHFGSRPRSPHFDRDDRRLRIDHAGLWPAGSPSWPTSPITHQWGGPLGVPAGLVRRRSASTGTRAWRGPAATWATAWRRRTWPGARWPTSSPAPTRRSCGCPGSTSAAGAWEPEPLRWLGHQRRPAPHRRRRRRRGPLRATAVAAPWLRAAHGR